jgi:hypothetical protein
VRKGRLNAASGHTDDENHEGAAKSRFGGSMSLSYEACIRRCALHHTANAITTAPANVNQVMAYCM